VVSGPPPGPGRLLLLLLAAATLLPSAARAQILTPWPYLPIEITPSVAVEERYTDNFFLSKVKVEEFRTSILPSLTIGATTGRNRSDVSYTLQVVDSSVRKDNPRFFHFLNGTDRFTITDRIFLTLKESLTVTDDATLSDARGIQRSTSRSNRQTTAVSAAYEGDLHGASLDYTRTSVTREVEPSTVFTSSRAAAATGTSAGTKFESLINAFGATGKLSLGPRMGLNVGATYTEADFTTTSAATSTTATSTSQVPFASGFTGYETSLGLTRELPNETIVTGTGSWSLRQPTVGEDLTIWRGQLGATRQVTPSIYGEVNAGFVLVQGAVEFSGPLATVKVTYVGPSIRATLSGGQTVQETFAQSVNVGLVQTRDLIASLTYSPTDRVHLNLGGGVVNTEFLQPDVAASQGVTATTTRRRPDSTLYTLNVSLTMNLTKVFTLYLSYDHRTREVDEQKGAQTTTNSTITNFDANTFTVRLTATYQ
jgi:hypothetical protein